MLFDSNIIIYSAKSLGNTLLELIYRDTPSVSVISYVEALGYHQLVDAERQSLEYLFENAIILPLSLVVADQAVSLRQQRRMGLGDAIIAATALVHDLSLVTHNTEDFRWINGLGLLDPLSI